MKRIRCKICGFAVIPEEGYCPYCGAVIQNIKMYVLKLMLFVLLLVSIIVLINVLADSM
jgi:rubredoxin